MVDIYACDQLIEIGRQQENEYRRVRFPMADVLGQYPDATFNVFNRRSADMSAYVVPASQISVEGTDVCWVLKASDLAYIGDGECEVIAYSGNTVAKDEIYTVRVLAALDEGMDPPDPSWDEYLSDLSAIADRAETAETGSAENALKAEGYAVGRQNGEPVDQESPYYHGNAAYFAGEAGVSAATAAGSAGDAAGSASAAGRSAGSAAGSAAAAETAQIKAEEAQAAAESARDQITGMTAEATTLDPGESATASYSDGVLSLGIPRGADGQDGEDGRDGADGYSPSASVNKSGSTATITITDKTGTTTAEISDGQDGTDGYTPQRGTDYWTAADKAEIVAEAESEFSEDISDIVAELSEQKSKIDTFEDDVYPKIGGNIMIGTQSFSLSNQWMDSSTSKYFIDIPANTPIVLRVEADNTFPQFNVYYTDDNGTNHNLGGTKSANSDITINVNYNIKAIYLYYGTSRITEDFTYKVYQSYIGSFETFQGKFQSRLLLENCTLVSKTNEENLANYSKIYSADTVVIKTSATDTIGIEIELDKPNIYSLIRAKASRSQGNNWLIRIRFFDSSSSIILQKYTTDSVLTMQVPPSTVRVKVTIAACWGTAIGADTNITFSNVLVEYADISQLMQDIEGIGTHEYIGEKIALSTDNKLSRCNINLWKSFTGDNTPSITEYSMNLNQSMTIYGGYVFLFNSAGTGQVLNYSTKEIIGTFTFTPTDAQHSNSAQFTNVYYSESDEFPLMLLSRCGNNAGSAPGTDECLIYRVQRTNTTFTFTLINKIYPGFDTYGNSWGIDADRNLLVMYACIGGTYSQGAPVYYYVFKMPTKTDILSGQAITLQESDIVEKFTFGAYTYQGCCVKNGRLFIGIQVSGSTLPNVYMIDLIHCTIASKISNLPWGHEIEGIAIYDGKLYYSQKNGSDTSGTNPLRIYEITFD